MSRRNAIRRTALHVMLIPGLLVILIYHYIPMAGIVIAFQKFVPAKGLFGKQTWIGLDNFRFVLSLPDTFRILRNTIFIAFMKIVGNLAVPLTISLLLNELNNQLVKRGIQTLVYLPHFLSWVILGGVLIDILSPQYGIVNHFLRLFGLKDVFFLGNVRWFPYVLVVSDVWKNFGFDTIIYLAAISSINPELYEAAVMDGASRWRQTWAVTLPGIQHIIVLLTVLSLGQILNAGFEQVFNLYSPLVYETGDIIDTFVYRIGLINMQYGVATAVGLFKSLVSFVFISVSYSLAYRLAGYRIF